MQIFSQTIRIGERSCITKPNANFSTKSTMDGDTINLTPNTETTISEKCRIGNKQISSETTLTTKAEINLPLECSISSEVLRCGRTKYTFESEEINRVRIRRVSIIDKEEQSKPQIKDHKSWERGNRDWNIMPDHTNHNYGMEKDQDKHSKQFPVTESKHFRHRRN